MSETEHLSPSSPQPRSDASDARARTRGRRVGRRPPRGGLWLGVPLWLAVLLLFIPAFATAVPEFSSRADLIANLSAQALLATLAIAVVARSLRRRRAMALALVLALVHILVLTSHRAAFRSPGPAAPDRTREARAREGVLRLIVFNASREQTQPQMVGDIRALAPDILAILEPTSFLWMSRDDLLSAPTSEPYPNPAAASGAPADLPADQLNTAHVLRRYAFWARRTPDSPQTLLGEGVLVSRWPLTPYKPAPDNANPMAASLLAAIVDPGLWANPSATAALPAFGAEGASSGRFLVILMHPPSPRSVERWLVGNEVVEQAAAMVAQARTEGLPVIVLGDMNSTPAGWRSRRLTSAGLRRAKPLLLPLGTWPTHAALNADGTGLPIAPNPDESTAKFHPDPDDRGLVGRWPLAIAIDDAWLSPEWELVGWSRGPSRGSDHWSVVVDVKRNSAK